jgi:hypothetical protein
MGESSMGKSNLENSGIKRCGGKRDIVGGRDME